eukprot:265433_1
MGNQHSETTSNCKPSAVAIDVNDSVTAIRLTPNNTPITQSADTISMITFSSARLSSSTKHSARISNSNNTLSASRISHSHSKISNEMVHINRMRKTKRNSIHNGIVGIYVSPTSVQLALNFWTVNITHLAMADQLEIGCSIFFAMIASDQKIKQILLAGNANPNKLETVSLKFLDMLGYLIRSLLRDDANVYSSLRSLGELHNKMCIAPYMYEHMLVGMHEAFTYYYPHQYTEQVKLAVTEVFTVVSHIMNGQPIMNTTVEYLQSLDQCLVSLDGKACLFGYLAQHGCHNIVLFYELLDQFKSKSDPIDRFMIARDIARYQIDGIHGKAKQIDVSPRTTQNVMNEMQRLDGLWFKQVPFTMESTFFETVEKEVYRFISDNHWSFFKQSALSTMY